MRTTVTLDPDVEQALREYMAREKVSFKEALNSAVRKGIGPRVEYTYVTPTFDLQPLVNMDNPRHVLAQLDIEDFLEKDARIRAQAQEQHAPSQPRKAAHS